MQYSIKNMIKMAMEMSEKNQVSLQIALGTIANELRNKKLKGNIV